MFIQLKMNGVRVANSETYRLQLAAFAGYFGVFLIFRKLLSEFQVKGIFEDVKPVFENSILNFFLQRKHFDQRRNQYLKSVVILLWLKICCNLTFRHITLCRLTQRIFILTECKNYSCDKMKVTLCRTENISS